MTRKPVATANWKMEMTVEGGLAYLRQFQANARRYLDQVDVIICPPCTALYPLARSLSGSPIQLGVQNLSVAHGGAYTGQVSARLAADAGARWAQLGHWELRRYQGETDAAVSQKVQRALEAGLDLILLVGEAEGVETEQARAAVQRQLACILSRCEAGQVARMVFVYEPEWAIGAREPAALSHVDAGCACIREWLASHYGPGAAQSARIAYGGSVTPHYADNLLSLDNLDGLGAGRLGRDPDAFSDIVRLVAARRAAGS
jgi:triosephosphate isomerase